MWTIENLEHGRKALTHGDGDDADHGFAVVITPEEEGRIATAPDRATLRDVLRGILNRVRDRDSVPPIAVNDLDEIREAAGGDPF